MATASAPTARVLFEALRPIRSRPTCQCLRLGAASRQPSHQRRNVSTGNAQYSEMEVDTPAPRWAQTPPAMKAPFSLRMRSAGGRHDVNKDPRKLDEMYTSFLGEDGPSLLSDETKWLAVTHKSFDHGRRGFNDRLAYFGKRIVDLQTSLGLLAISKPSSELVAPDAHGRTVFFEHPAIDGVEGLTDEKKLQYTSHKRVAHIAERHGLHGVMRWVPKHPDRLEASGKHLVYSQAIYAIIGALALERGSAVANRVTRERLLAPLGINAQRIEEKKPLTGL